ncbi:hypothetical protein L3Q82_020761, partial [Scortum barcoo]
FLPPRLSLWLSVHPRLRVSGSSSLPLMSTSHIHYHMALAQSALFPSVVLNYSVFLGQALVSSHCNDFLIICLYVMNEMEMYHHGQTGLALCQAATPQSGRMGAGRAHHDTGFLTERERCSEHGHYTKGSEVARWNMRRKRTSEWDS